ncbi:MAG: urease accessory protein UreD [Pseudomonadota bacterium]
MSSSAAISLSPSREASVRPDGWEALLELVLAPRGDRTRISARRHFGPLVVQRALYPEGDLCHVVLLHPPGGMVGHDRLTTDVTCSPDAQALVTTPGANKVYLNLDRPVRQTQTLRVEAGACLEWLPQPLIVFDGAHAELDTRIELADDAAFIGWDAICLGRPAIGEAFSDGRLRQRLRLGRASGDSLYEEYWQLDGGDRALHAPWGLAGRSVLATLFAYPADDALLEQARHAVSDVGNGDGATAQSTAVGCSLLDHLLVARVLADGAEPAFAALEQLWRALREATVGRVPVRPRIWST